MSEKVDDMKLGDVVEALTIRQAIPDDMEIKLRWMLTDALYWDEDDGREYEQD